jgi:predicted component of type VI protein secretion system
VAEHAYQLVVRKGPKPGQLFPLTLETITVGRDPASDIPIDDVEVSRRHARLIHTDEGYQIQDVGSTNGTFVDGKRLAGEPQLLLPGQVIILGSNVNLVYQMVAEPDPFATVIAPLGEEPEEPAGEGVQEESQVEEAGEAPPAPPSPIPAEPAVTVPEPIDEEPAELEPVGEMAMVEADVEEEMEAVEPEVDAEEVAEAPADAPLAEAFAEAEPEPAPEEDEEEALATILEAPFPPAGEEEPVLDVDEEAAPMPPPEAETATPFPSFARAEGQDIVDSGEPMVDMEPQAAVASPPLPPPTPPKPSGNNRNRNIILIVAAIILLLCCCLVAVVLIILYFVPVSTSSSVAPIGAMLALTLAGRLL